MYSSPSKPVGRESRVQVFARARPESTSSHFFSPFGHGGGGGSSSSSSSCVEVDEDAGIIRVRNELEAVDRILQGHGPDVSIDSVEARSFCFDGVFGGSASQQDVFDQVGRPVLQGCLQGVNGTILAYGQTGSGKTYSLQHRGSNSDEAGLLPRLVASLYVQVAQDVHNVYEIEAAALQIYNEQVDDLIHFDKELGTGFGLSVQNGGSVAGLTWAKCPRPENMLDAFKHARSNLIYAETKMNKASSRSHAVFLISITKRSRNSGATVTKMECTRARMTVVDLAGSERVKKSQVEGMHLKEAVAINRSLLAFGNVVSALAARRHHVPFRESKLTRILDGSVGGNCRTSLLVCLSTLVENAAETMSTLEFASRALRVEVDAKVNHEVVEVPADGLVDDLCGNLGDIATAALREELASLQLAVSEAKRLADEEAARRISTASEAESDARSLRAWVERLSGDLERSREKEQELLASAQSTEASEAGLKEKLLSAERQIETLKQEVNRTTSKLQEVETKRSDEVALLHQARQDLEKARLKAEDLELRTESLETDRNEAVKRAELAEAELESELEVLMTEIEEQGERDDDRQREAEELATQERVRAQEKLAVAQAEAQDWRNRALAAESRAAALAKELAQRRNFEKSKAKAQSYQQLGEDTENQDPHSNRERTHTPPPQRSSGTPVKGCLTPPAPTNSEEQTTCNLVPPSGHFEGKKLSNVVRAC